MLDALQQLLTLDSLATLFMVLAGICLVTGITLVISPSLFHKVAVPMNRLFSARRALKTWEVPRPTERFFYRHHKIFGLLILLGIGVYFGEMAGHSRSALVKGLSASLPTGTADWLIPGLLDFFLVANTLIFFVGLVMLLRPSLLKGVEARANRWISTRRLTRRFVEPNDAAEGLVRRAPRLVGACIIFGSLYILVNFALI